MSGTCFNFRRLLEGALVGKPDPRALTDLSFHEHLFACSPCRELLEGEEALEVLLDSWPHPELPAALSARLVERLREACRLEELLELDSPPAIPEGLAARVLQGLAAVSPGDAASDDVLDARLDVWLERAGEVRVPEGLSARVHAALRETTRSTAGREWWQRVPARRAAAALIATLTLAAAWRLVGGERPTPPGRELEIAMAVPPDELLTALPVLENWEVLFGDHDLDLATGMDFTAEDEALLEFPDPEEESGR